VPRPRELAALNDPELEKDCVLSGGDDYELLFTVAPERREEVASLSAELGLPLSLIGAIRGGEPTLMVLDERGAPLRYRGGFEHFGTPPG
jgi:thiamine-monophosphate kinase